MVTNGPRAPRSRRRIMTFVVALALNLALVANAFAAELVNGEFEIVSDYYSFCSTSGWTTSGNVGANTQYAYGLATGSAECVARVQASDDGSEVSTLSQTVTVTGATLVMLLDTASFNANADSQTITLYNSKGFVIYTKSNNTNGVHYYFCKDVSAYQGQTIRIEIKTSLGKSYLRGRSATIYADTVHFSAGCFWPSSASSW